MKKETQTPVFDALIKESEDWFKIHGKF